jgi:hypothetical protein
VIFSRFTFSRITNVVSSANIAAGILLQAKPKLFSKQISFFGPQEVGQMTVARTMGDAPHVDNGQGLVGSPLQQ